MIYAFYIFSERNTCVFHKIWNKGTASELRNEDTFELVSGFVSTSNSLAQKISPVANPSASRMTSISTNTYKLSCMETPTRVKFVFITDHVESELRSEFLRIYEEIYVEFVVKNPLQDREGAITNAKFDEAIEKYVKSLPIFSSKRKT